MFRGPSWIRRAGVTLLLLVSLGAGIFALPHADDADVACSPILVAHDESAHHIRRRPDSSAVLSPNTVSSVIPFVRSTRPSISSSTTTMDRAPSGCMLRRSIALALPRGRSFLAAHRPFRHLRS